MSSNSTIFCYKLVQRLTHPHQFITQPTHLPTNQPFKMPSLRTFLYFLALTLALPIYAQMEIIFAYYTENTGCTKHVPPGNNAKSQSIATGEYGQCVPVHLTLDGTFDVQISKMIYWTNQLTPVIKACPTIDCDLYDDSGCCE